MSAIKKVLIADGDANRRLVLTTAVKRAGYAILVATTGIDAIRKTFADKPNLIIIDYSLPGLNGAEATAILKADPTTQNIPVVIQTDFGNGRFEGHAVKIGAAEILRKPIRAPEIDSVLRRYLTAQRIAGSNIAHNLSKSDASNPRERPAQPDFSPFRTVGDNLDYRIDQTFVRQT